ESKGGNISIKGSIQGTGKEKVDITSGGNLLVQEAASISHVKINTRGSVTVDANISNCSITSGGDITIQGKVTASYLNSEGLIKIQSCGDGEHECVIEAKPCAAGFVN